MLDDFREGIYNIELQRDGLDIYSAGRYEGDAKSYGRIRECVIC